MVDSITIRNFRSFSEIKIENFSRINILVGENGSGKTALLEAMFLAGGVSPEIAVRTRNWRGVGGDVAGTMDDINYALWGDLFHRFQTTKPAFISLRGTGDETRSVTVTLNKRGHRTVVAPPRNKPGSPVKILADPAPLEFKWKVQNYPDVSVFPIFQNGKLTFSEVSDRYVKASFFAANQTTSALEVANRFSHLSKAFDDKNFISTFQSMYPNISELSIELSAGRPMLFAHVAGLPEKIPLSLASGGMSKLAAILLGMTEQRGGFVIIDEIENGFYHSKLGDIWRTLIDFSIEYDCQLFISTHSNECLKAAARFAEEDPEMFTIIRTVLVDGETKIRQFSGDRFANAILSDVEIR